MQSSQPLSFVDLPVEQQERAKAMFINARADDGYTYELGLDGNVLCRNHRPQRTTVSSVVN